VTHFYCLLSSHSIRSIIKYNRESRELSRVRGVCEGAASSPSSLSSSSVGTRDRSAMPRMHRNRKSRVMHDLVSDLVLLLLFDERRYCAKTLRSLRTNTRSLIFGARDINYLCAHFFFVLHMPPFISFFSRLPMSRLSATSVNTSVNTSVLPPTRLIPNLTILYVRTWRRLHKRISVARVMTSRCWRMQ